MDTHPTKHKFKYDIVGAGYAYSHRSFTPIIREYGIEINIYSARTTEDGNFESCYQVTAEPEAIVCLCLAYPVKITKR